MKSEASATTVDQKSHEVPSKVHATNNMSIQRQGPVRSQWRQWLACLSATLSMVAAGTVYGWTTTILSRLLVDEDGKEINNDVPIHITSSESSWIVAFTVIGGMIGPFLGAWLADKYGRKKCMLITSLFYIVGWLIVLNASCVEAIYASRVILGIGIGISYVVNPLYVSEVAENNIRGALCTFISINTFTGSLLACSVGPFVSYDVLCAVLISIVALFFATFVWFPETPYYLASKNKNYEAVKVLAYFRGLKDHELARRELEEVLNNIGKNAKNYEDDEENKKLSLRDKLTLLMIPSNRRALCIIVGLIAGQSLSGSFSTMQYLERLFTNAHIGIDSNLATVIVLAVGMVSGLLTTLTIDVFGRRPLLIISTVGSAITLGILAAYLMMDAYKINVSSFNLLPVADVILFQIFYQVGLGTMPSLLIGELFPTNVKGIAGAIITLSDGIFGFTVSKLYQVIGDLIGIYYVYFIFSGSCFVAFLFVYAYVPETRCKPFSYIQEILASNNFASKHRKNDADNT